MSQCGKRGDPHRLLMVKRHERGLARVDRGDFLDVAALGGFSLPEHRVGRATAGETLVDDPALRFDARR